MNGCPTEDDDVLRGKHAPRCYHTMPSPDACGPMTSPLHIIVPNCTACVAGSRLQASYSCLYRRRRSLKSAHASAFVLSFFQGSSVIVVCPSPLFERSLKLWTCCPTRRTAAIDGALRLAHHSLRAWSSQCLPALSGTARKR